MKKSLTTKILAVISVFCFIMALIGVWGPIGVNSAPSSLAVSEIFLPSDMILTPSVVAEDGETDEPGLLITSKSTASSIQLRQSIIGEISFIVAPEIKENNPTVQTMRITITDDYSKEYFNIVVDYSSVTSVSVEIDGQKAGLVYMSNTLKGLTHLANASGIYTQYASLLSTVTFNAENMGVYVGEGASATLVWDLTKSSIDGRTVSKAFDTFKSYSVQVSYDKFVGESAGVIFYSINGNALDKIILNQPFAPQFMATFTRKGLVGSQYVLPSVSAFDMLQGKLTGVTTSVKSPSGTEVSLSNGTFTPTESGNYTVTYTATNGFDVSNSKAYTVEVLSEMPDYNFELESQLPQTAELNDVVRIPQMTLTGGLLLSGEEIATVSVKRNGRSQAKYQNVKSGFDFVCEKIGTYKFIYSVGDQTEEYIMTVINPQSTFEYEYQFDTAYDIDAYLDLTDYKLLVDDVKTDCTVKITYPDGKVYSDKRFILTQTGTYEIKIATVDGQKAIIKQFSVFELAKDLFTCNADGATVSYGTSNFTGRTGVYVNTKQSATEIIYNQPINISKYVNQTKEAKKDGETVVVHGEDKVYIADDAIPLIEMSIEPNKYNSQVMREFEVVITDAADPTNSISVYFDSMNSKTWSYVQAKAGSQGYAGWLQNVSGTDKLYKDRDHGFLVACSVAGYVNDQFSAADSKFELYYDNEEKQLLTYSGWDRTHGGQLHCIIADFDNPDLSNGLPWGGFTSDTVYLKIILGTIKSGNGGCHIYAVDGINLTQEGLAYGNPEIKVDMPEKDGMQFDLVGIKGKALTIPSAVAVDEKGERLAIKTAVYYSDGQNKFNVHLTDGKFATDRAGKYIIEYTATDRFKNTTTERIEATVYETYEDIIVSAEVDEIYKSGKTGASVALMPSKLLNVINALGLYTVSEKVTFEEEPVEVIGGAFVPQKVGSYTVEYTVKDSTDREQKYSYTVEIEIEEKPVIVSAIPEYVGFIQGNTYDLYDIYVMDYMQADLTARKADVYIKEPSINGQPSEFKLYTANTYQPAKTAIEEKDVQEIIDYVTIEYRYNGQVIDGLTYQIPVRNPYKADSKLVLVKPNPSAGIAGGWQEIPVTLFKVERYFLADENLSISFGDSIRFTASEQADGQTTVRFIQSVDPTQMLLSFKMLGNAAETNVKSFTLTITDASDSSKTVKIKIVYEEGYTKLYIGDTLTSGGFYGTLDNSTEDVFSFIFKNGEGALFDVKNNRNTGIVETFANGEKFSGFGNKVHLKYQIEKIDQEKSAGFEILGINGQSFPDGMSEDVTSPLLTINGKLSGNYEYQSNVTIPSVNASDVLSNVDESSLTVTVKRETPDGEEVVKDVNGLPLDNVSSLREYTVNLDKTGSYKAYYNVRDTRNGVRGEEVLSFTVVMKENPVITLKGAMPTTAKVNSTIKIPAYSVQFAQESEENVYYVIYVAPSDRHQYVNAEENAFVATEIGTYTVRIFALDVSGSYTLNEYQIVVTA